MTTTTRKTMTAAQMAWNVKKGFAWFEQDQHGNVNDDWRAPIWTREGGYLWDVDAQVYEMVL